MSALVSQPITAPLTAAVTPAVQAAPYRPQSLAIYAVFTYGSGGTTFSVWIQTSLDGGQTWVDIANVSGTTASLKSIVNLSALTAVTTTPAITDGTLASNTTLNGVLGTLYRVKVTTTGVYAGGTTLSVYASPGLARLTA
jgi:hypothetical protein